VTYRITLSAVTLPATRPELERHRSILERGGARETEQGREGTRFGVLDTSLLARYIQDTRLIQAHTFQELGLADLLSRATATAYMTENGLLCFREKSHKGVRLEYTVLGNKAIWEYAD
jgi:hypothetical protein